MFESVNILRNTDHCMRQLYEIFFLTRTTNVHCVSDVTTPSAGDCEDKEKYCPQWAKHGFCEDNPNSALRICKKSCKVCDNQARTLLTLRYIMDSSAAVNHDHL